MTGLRAWFAQHLHGWLAGFKARHGLANTLTAPPVSDAKKVLLHVGDASPHFSHVSILGFQLPIWDECRVHFESGLPPIGPPETARLSAVPSGSADAIVTFRTLEYLPWTEVRAALADFLRVLRQDGFAVVCCADVEAFACEIAPPSSAIAQAKVPNHAPSVADLLNADLSLSGRCPPAMSHRCGFAFDHLVRLLRAAGFPSVAGFRRPSGFDLWVVASKDRRSDLAMRALASNYLVLLD